MTELACSSLTSILASLHPDHVRTRTPPPDHFGAQLLYVLQPILQRSVESMAVSPLASIDSCLSGRCLCRVRVPQSLRLEGRGIQIAPANSRSSLRTKLRYVVNDTELLSYPVKRWSQNRIHLLLGAASIDPTTSNRDSEHRPCLQTCSPTSLYCHCCGSLLTSYCSLKASKVSSRDAPCTNKHVHFGSVLTALL